SGEYAYCKPSMTGECPVGFLCDQSFVLGRSICCQDLRNQPASSSLSPTVGWSTISAATETTEQSRWTPFSIMSTRKAPWYIKERTPWDSIYTHTTLEATIATPSSTESSTTTSTEPATSTTTSATTTTADTTT
uniref:Uncharacterized protein n=1 Tax=Parascaris univalens TaxID=6257 RepID=A0A915AST4_PARUN